MKQFLIDLIDRYKYQLITSITVVLLIGGSFSFYNVAVKKQTSNDECIWYPSPPHFSDSVASNSSLKDAMELGYEVGKKSYKEKKAVDSLVLTFLTVKPDGVTAQAGIENGDKLLAINGIPAREPLQMQAVLNSFDYGEYAPYTIKKKDGRIIETKVFVKKLVDLNKLTSILTGLFILLTAFIVMMGNPYGKTQQLFFAMGVSFVASTLGVSFLIPNSFVLEYSVFSIAVVALNLAIYSSVSVLVILFFINFPEPRIKPLSIPVKFLIFGPLSLVFLGFLFEIITVFFVKEMRGLLGQYAVSFGIAGILAISSMYAAFFIMYFKIKRIQDPVKKKQLKYVLGALGLVLVANTYSIFVLPNLQINQYNNPEAYLSVIFLLFLPISIAYTIFKYQLLDITYVLNNTLTYGLATVAVASVYLTIVYYLGQTVGLLVPTEYKNFVAGLAFLFFALVFQSGKDKLQTTLTRKFFPEQFQLQVILEMFAKQLVNIVGRSTIIETIKTTFEEKLNVKNFAVYVIDEHHVLNLETSIGAPELPVSLSTTFDDELINIPEIKKKSFVDDVNFSTIFPKFHSLLFKSNIHTAIPLMVNRRLIGLMFIGTKHFGGKFIGKDLELLVSIAEQTAISLENARLYKAEAEKDKYKSDLMLARDIQQNLLPISMPHYPGIDMFGGMIPAEHIGGDYFDIVPISESKFFVIIGDAAGKGLPASIHMTRLQTMFQIYCLQGLSPKEIVSQVNAKITSTFDKKFFITAIIALFDLEKKIVTFCRAGHTPLIKIGTNLTEILKPQGLAIGMAKEGVFSEKIEEVTVPMNSGDLFFFYSDGVNEARKKSFEFWGDESLMTFLESNKNQNTESLYRSLLNEIEEFRGKEEQNDDITIVAVKIN